MAARKPGLEHIKGTIGIRGHDAQERIGQLRRALDALIIKNGLTTRGQPR